MKLQCGYHNLKKKEGIIKWQSQRKHPAKKTTTAKKPAAKKAPAKKTSTKKPTAKKLGKIIIEIDGQQIDVKAIEKKAAKLGGDVYVVASEKKIFDKDGYSVDLF